MRNPHRTTRSSLFKDPLDEAVPEACSCVSSVPHGATHDRPTISGPERRPLRGRLRFSLTPARFFRGAPTSHSSRESARKPKSGTVPTSLIPVARRADRTVRLKDSRFLICPRDMRNPHRNTKESISGTFGIRSGSRSRRKDEHRASPLPRADHQIRRMHQSSGLHRRPQVILMHQSITPVNDALVRQALQFLP